MIVTHPLKPIYDKDSITLILGSMPSIKSRELNKYYGNKTNRFWLVLSKIYDEDTTNYQEFILKHHLALWDVIESCDIKNSSDSSIKNVSPNDISSIVDNSNIKNIITLGNTAYKLYNKYIYPTLKIEAILLPSPSSANASMHLEDLIEKYQIIKDITK